MNQSSVGNRTPSEHDVDRLLYSSAYRRLNGITQVVAVGEHQIFHNRLIHTQKVAQLSRRIAEQVARASDSQERGISVDIAACEAAGLAHDLGHPPFGHVAERVLDRLCTEHGTDGFEGNAQSFRIVTKLAVRRISRDDADKTKTTTSLQLQPTTLRGVLKYPWLSDDPTVRPLETDGKDESDSRMRKWGAYLSEKAAFRRVHSEQGLEQSLEASIMDWADDISYAVHDFEDFFRAGFIDLSAILRSDEALDEFVTRAHGEWKGESWTLDDARRDFENFIDSLDLRGPFDGTEDSRSTLNSFSAEQINRYVTGTRIDSSNTVDVNSALRTEVHFLKQLTWQFVINRPSLASLQRGQELLIEELFVSLIKWVEEERRQQRLPTRLIDLLQRARLDSATTEDPEAAARARAVADYICCLTEDQAIDMHARLRGNNRGSIQDTWVSF